MDALLLARIQFAMTVGFHFLFPPLTIGLSWFIFRMMNHYSRTGEEIFLQSARFWIKILTATFAIGVATGITMEFQFGTNWSEYSRFVGDIFGAPLAAEGVFAFFLESTFLGILIFGWNRLPFKTMKLASFMVAFGATISAFFIIVANSWQQTPAGYHLVNGRAELTNFYAAVFNPSTLPRFFHTMTASIMTASFFILGVLMYYLLKNRAKAFTDKFLLPTLITALVASVLQLGLGHWHAIQVAYTQPEKLAAIEGLFESQTEAPALIFGIPNANEEKVEYAFRAPGLLSLLAFGSLDAKVQGLEDFPKEDWPPLYMTFFPFHLMVALGLFFIGFPALALILHYFKLLTKWRWYLWIGVIAIAFPFMANELGWISAEVGRQPWIVYHVLRTSDSVSISVPASQILVSLIVFALIYLFLFIVWVGALKRIIESGPEAVTLSPEVTKR